jgi:hypothetical protein
MKRIFSILILLSLSAFVAAQQISKISISYAGVTGNITVNLNDNNAVINISPKGEIVNYGTEYFSERISAYSRVETYNGRLEMYAATDDKALAGKLKYIGRTAVTYYASYENELLRGKIKSIGNLLLNYYMEYDNESDRGKIKNIGNNGISYYSSFENEELRGKLKSVGSTSLTYYSSYDDKAFKGKIKSIGSFTFTYYPSFDRQFAGALKSGNMMQNIVAGINYVIQ